MGVMTPVETTEPEPEMMPPPPQLPPDISLSWSGVEIEVKILGSDQDSYLPLYPNADPKIRKIKSHRRRRRRRGGGVGGGGVGGGDGIGEDNGGDGALFSTLSSWIDSNGLDVGSRRQADETATNAQSSSPTPTSTTSSEFQQPENVKRKGKKCHVCGKSFNKLTYLKRHVLSHSKVKPFKCNVCGWGFFQLGNLKRHMTSHSGEGSKCPHCDATFSTKSVMSVHLREAHGDKMTKTSEATESSTSSTTNANPTTTTTTPTLTAKFGCNVCGKQFQKKENFQNHIALHRQNKVYDCNICKLRFSDEFIWRKHTQLHHLKSMSEATKS